MSSLFSGDFKLFNNSANTAHCTLDIGHWTFDIRLMPIYNILPLLPSLFTPLLFRFLDKSQTVLCAIKILCGVRISFYYTTSSMSYSQFFSPLYFATKFALLLLRVPAHTRINKTITCNDVQKNRLEVIVEIPRGCKQSQLVCYYYLSLYILYSQSEPKFSDRSKCIRT